MDYRSGASSTQGGPFYSEIYDESDSVSMPTLERTKRMTVEIARNVIASSIGRTTERSQTKYSKTMLRVVGELQSKHQILFNGMMNRLSISYQNASEIGHMFCSICDEVFADHKYNWGRICTVFAFAATIAKYVVDNRISNGVKYEDRITEVLIDYINSNLAFWIDSEGGWDAFCDFFPAERTAESLVRGGLVAAVVGLGALATLLAVR